MSASDNPFLERITARITHEPDRVFAEVWAGPNRESLTWSELGRRAAGFANACRRAGVRADDVVFLILRHGSDLYPACLGAMLAGAVPSFLPFPNPKQDADLYWSSHLAVFRRTGAKLLVTYGELAEAVRSRAAGLVDVIDIATVASGEPSGVPSRPETAVALLQHSSGTTGLKKGVALSYRAIRLQLDAYTERLAIDHDTCVIASWLPLYHDMGLIACFMLPLYLGIKVVSLDAFEWTTRPALLLEAIEAHRATHAWFPNFAFAHIARATSKKRRYELGSLRAVIGCSEPNKPEVFDLFAARFESEGVRAEALQACYAMAETVFAVSQSGIGPRRLDARIVEGKVTIASGSGPSVSYVSNGTPLPGVDVRILTEGRVAADGTVGEICVRAPFLFDGYFADPATTAAAFVDGFFRTGDLGFLMDGEIYVSGRSKELIIVNGRNFFANDIESVANEVAGVKKGRCVAFGYYLAALGAEQIVVVAEREAEVAPAGDLVGAIASALNSKIGTAPGDVRIVDPGWLVKTTSGKLSRAENIRKYVEAFQAGAALSVPESMT